MPAWAPDAPAALAPEQRIWAADSAAGAANPAMLLEVFAERVTSRATEPDFCGGRAFS